MPYRKHQHGVTLRLYGQSARNKTEIHMSGITLYTIDASTHTGYGEATFEEFITGARQAVSRKVRRGTTLSSPRTTADYLMARLAQHPHEVFTLIYLDKRHRLIACQDLFRGTIDGASIHPREVVKEALNTTPPRLFWHITTRAGLQNPRKRTK
jgi:DNA repair protein RadC